MNALKLITVVLLSMAFAAPAHAQKKQTPIEIFKRGEASDTGKPIEITTGVEGQPNNATQPEDSTNGTNGATNNGTNDLEAAAEAEAKALEQEFCAVATNISPALVVGNQLEAEVLTDPDAVDKWWPFLKSAKYSVTGKKSQSLKVEKRSWRVVLRTRYNKKALGSLTSDLTLDVRLKSDCPNSDVCGEQKLEFKCESNVRRLSRTAPKKEKFTTVEKRLKKAGMEAQEATSFGRVVMIPYKGNSSKTCVFKRASDAVEYDCPIAVGARHLLMPGLGPYLLVVKSRDLWSLARGRANPKRVDIRSAPNSFEKGQFEFGSWGKGTSFTAKVNGEEKTLKAE